jgi:hypothetical protein
MIDTCNNGLHSGIIKKVYGSNSGWTPFIVTRILREIYFKILSDRWLSHSSRPIIHDHRTVFSVPILFWALFIAEGTFVTVLLRVLGVSSTFIFRWLGSERTAQSSLPSDIQYLRQWTMPNIILVYTIWGSHWGDYEGFYFIGYNAV